MSTLLLALKFARRERRAGLSGFRIFFLCLVLGVSAIAAVESLSQTFLTGLAEQGRTLLGGDVSVRLVHRPATMVEREFLSRYGRVSETASTRAMAYAMHGAEAGARELVELKAVDGSYPLYSRVTLSPDDSEPLACTGTVCGAAAEQTLLDRLHLRVGGIVRIGVADFRISSVLVGEPDRISDGFSLGPHILISQESLRRTGLIQPGSLIDYDYRVAFSHDTPLREFRRQAVAAFSDAGWEIRDRNNAAPGVRSFIEQVTMFLGLVGLAVLAIGGLGASEAVRAFLDRKRDEIATLKALGAGSTLVFLTFFVRIMAISIAAILVGLVIGAVIPFAFGYFGASNVPAPAHFALYARALALAAAFGILSAMVFAIPPLARTRDIAPASLFRDLVVPARGRVRLLPLACATAAGLAILGLALSIAPSPIFAAEFAAGAIAVLVVLRLIAAGLRALVGHAPRSKRASLRLALANLARPGAGTTGVVTALGLGLSLLATVSLLDRSILAEVSSSLPATAPSFFFVDIQPDQTAAFDATIRKFKSAEDYERTPMIRGRIIALNGVPARDAKVAPDAKWAIAGDRGITYAATPPKDAKIVEGKWWPAHYQGRTLISFDAELAKGMGLKLGDTITLNVLGREIEGRIANLRDVNFRTGRQNFILVLSPGIIDKAPHSFLATVRVDPRDEEPLYRAVTDRFPNVSTVRVKDAITQVIQLLQELAFGVRAASLVTILAGLLVLAGAIGAGASARLYDATLLKVVGATRPWIARVYTIEYGLLGLLTGVLALGAGTLAAALVSQNLLSIPFVFDLGAALLTILSGGAATLVFGLAGSFAALAARPARQLRIL